MRILKRILKDGNATTFVYEDGNATTVLHGSRAMPTSWWRRLRSRVCGVVKSLLEHVGN